MNDSSKYPARSRRSGTLKEISTFSDSEGKSLVAAGRVKTLEHNGKESRLLLEDYSGKLEVRLPAADENPPVKKNDIVEITGKLENGIFTGEKLVILAESRISPGPELKSQYNRRELLQLRSEIISHIRAFFLDQGFMEIEAPYLYRYPSLDPQISPVSVLPDSGKKPPVPFYLPTSPEFPMKRLLANGYDRIFSLGKVFRNEPQGPYNLPEFTMLEWYRAYSDYTKIMDDTRKLILYILDELGMESSALRFGEFRIDLKSPWPGIKVSELFQESYDINVDTLTDESGLRKAAGKVFPEINGTWNYSDIFFKLFLEKIEKNLGILRPVFVLDYPLQLGALAKKCGSDPRFVERFELYIGGMELANAYTELNDPDEQEQRFQQALRERRSAGKPVYPIDTKLLDCMKYAIPPAGGNALGVDRLIMLLTNTRNIRDIVWFPPEY